MSGYIEIAATFVLLVVQPEDEGRRYFVPNPSRVMEAVFGNQMHKVRLDLEGRVVFLDYHLGRTLPDKPKAQGPAGPPKELDAWLPYREPQLLMGITACPAWEYRCGRVIHGHYQHHARGRPVVFVPTVGKKVVKLEEFDPEGQLPEIYNLPGDLTPRAREEFANRKTRPSAPPSEAEISKRFRVPQQKPFVKPAKDRYVSYHVGAHTYFGFVDEVGLFVPDVEIPMVEGKPEQLPYPDLMKPLKPDEPVFEYRVGRLIPGKLSKAESDGIMTFVPDLGGVVIEHRKDLPELKTRRIYNVPSDWPR